MSSDPVMEKLHKFVDVLGGMSGVRHIRQSVAHQRFLNNKYKSNLFEGVFDTYEDAEANAPKVLSLGYDNDDSALMYQGICEPTDRDFSAMFWLEKSFGAGLSSVVDLGGSIGIKYYAFAKYLSLPAGLRWTVCDVPAVVRNGRRIANERGVSSQLHFTDQYADMSGVDVLYASGSVQYLPKPFDQVIADLAVKPRRILVNTAAIHPDKNFYTLNHIGSAYCPYRVQSVERFVGGVEAQGYKLMAQWSHPEKRLDLPFDEGHSLTSYKGFCFDRVGNGR